MAAADYRMMTDATGQDLVAALQNLAPLQVAPLVVSIPTGQWSGSGSDYYITVNASNVTANSIVVPFYDEDSRKRLKGPVWCVPEAGSFTIHTSAIPTNTVTILVQIPGTMGEAQYQVLADVYSTSQAVAKADIVNNLTSTSTTTPLSANMGKALNEAIAQSTANIVEPGTCIRTVMSGSNGIALTFASGSSACVFMMTQYGHAFYIYAAADGGMNYKNLGLSSITPTISGRTLSIPTGGYNRCCFVINSSDPHSVVTISAY